MGQGSSSNGRDKGSVVVVVARSPSAAFGRLRIDSPTSPAFHSPATRRRTRQAAHGSANELSPLVHKTLPGSASAGNLLSDVEHRVLQVTSFSHYTHHRPHHTDASLPSSVPDYDAMAADGTAPPFYIWLGPALVCALMYALYNICIKRGSAHIHPVLGGVILQFVAALLGALLLTVLLLGNRDAGGGDDLAGSTDTDGSAATGAWADMPCDRTGVTWAVLAGAAVGAAEILSFIVSGMGVPAVQSIPTIIGGSVLFGTALGVALLKEALTARGWGGVALIAAGIALVGVDPGGAGSVH